MTLTIRQEAARLAERFGIFPTTADKLPAWLAFGRNGAGQWAHNDARTGPTGAETADRWFSHPSAQGLAVWCGDVQCIDFDDPEAVAPWVHLVRDHGLSPILQRCATAKTRNGFHVWCHVPGCAHGNQKLARFAARTWSEARGKHVEERIETRGVGGYALVHPSPGYSWTRGDLLTLEPLSAAEYDDLLVMAAALDLRTDPPEPQYAPAASQRRTDREGESPGDWFNRTETWRELLEPEGAQFIRRVGDREHWRRPGKKGGNTSATTGNGFSGQDLLRIHSSNWPGIESGRSYDKFGFYARLFFGGDLSAAALAIMRRPGYPRARRGGKQ